MHTYNTANSNSRANGAKLFAEHTALSRRTRSHRKECGLQGQTALYLTQTKQTLTNIICPTRAPTHQQRTHIIVTTAPPLHCRKWPFSKSQVCCRVRCARLSFLHAQSPTPSVRPILARFAQPQSEQRWSTRPHVRNVQVCARAHVLVRLSVSFMPLN